MKICSECEGGWYSGNIVLHSPGADHVCFGAGTLIKQVGPILWRVQFFDGREFEMANWSLKKITGALTEHYIDGKITK